MSRIMITIFIASTQLLAGVAPATAQDAGSGSVDFDALSEDIEIMRRVLDKALKNHTKKLIAKAGEDDDEQGVSPDEVAVLDESGNTINTALALSYYKLALGNARLPGYTIRTNIEGFLLPGTGVLYTLDVPAVLKEVDPPKDDRESKDDLWNSVKEDLQESKSNLWRSRGIKARKSMTVDEEDLDQTIELLIDTILDYGSRIEQLSAGDSIILAGRLKYRQPAVSTSGITQGGYGVGTLWYGDTAQSRQRIIVKVPVSAVQAFKDGGISRKTCRERAEITRYKSHASKNSNLLYSYSVGSGSSR